MIFIWALIAAVAAGAANGDSAGRIIGGEFIEIEKHPSLVQVEFRNTFLIWSQSCSGTILSKRHVISAAQCFDGLLFNVRDRRIRAGSSTRNRGGVVVDVSQRINHPSYKRSGHDGDISIVELKTDLIFTPSIQSTMIVKQGFEMFNNLPVTHAGWGSTIVGGGDRGSSQLRHVQVFTIKHSVCAERYKYLHYDVTNNMICSGVLDVGGRDTSEGDEGGPLYFNNDILVGIVSWSFKCGDLTWPRVNTKVSSYADWINEHVGLESM